MSLPASRKDCETLGCQSQPARRVTHGGQVQSAPHRSTMAGRAVSGTRIWDSQLTWRPQNCTICLALPMAAPTLHAAQPPTPQTAGYSLTCRPSSHPAICSSLPIQARRVPPEPGSNPQPQFPAHLAAVLKPRNLLLLVNGSEGGAIPLPLRWQQLGHRLPDAAGTALQREAAGGEWEGGTRVSSEPQSSTKYNCSQGLAAQHSTAQCNTAAFKLRHSD